MQNTKQKSRRWNDRIFALAERVGFEPTVPLLVHLISSQGRYNHFDTAPYSVDWLVCIIAGCPGKIKDEFVAQQVQCRESLRADIVPFMGIARAAGTVKSSRRGRQRCNQRNQNRPWLQSRLRRNSLL